MEQCVKKITNIKINGSNGGLRLAAVPRAKKMGCLRAMLYCKVNNENKFIRFPDEIFELRFL